MPKRTDKTAQPGRPNPVLAGLLAWLVPGAGHWYLDRPIRAAVLFVAIQALFWSGVAIGGIFTVNPRQEIWWSRAQRLTGLSGLVWHQRQNAMHARYYRKAVQDYGGGADPNVLSAAADQQLTRDHLALVQPAAGLAYVLSGVAGMLNLMCIFDAIMLAMLGQWGEKEDAASGKPVRVPPDAGLAKEAP
jgi:hypothetical protein